MSFTITISGTPVKSKLNSLTRGATIGERTTCSFVVPDVLGQYHFKRREKVQILNNSIPVFTGYINDVSEALGEPGPLLYHTISCTDLFYVADKRLVTESYDTFSAGDMVCDLLDKYAAQEGITVKHTLFHESKQTEWATGTHTRTASTALVDNGAVQLSYAGTELTIIDSSTSELNNKTSSSQMDISNNQMQLGYFNGIKVHGTIDGTIDPSLNASNAYIKIMRNIAYTIVSGDVLYYDIYLPSDSIEHNGGIDLNFTTGLRMQDAFSQGIIDQNGIKVNPNQNLSTYTNQWYSRKIRLTSSGISLAGKILSFVTVGLEADNVGYHYYYIRRAKIMNGATLKVDIFNDTDASTHYNKINNRHGYSEAKLSVEKCRYPTGNRISVANSLTNVSILKQISVSDVSDVPDTTTLTHYASIDSGATYNILDSNNNVQDVIPGMLATGKTLLVKTVMTQTGPNPELTPTLYSITQNAKPSYTMATPPTVSSTSWFDATSWNLGTHSKTVASGNALTIINHTRDWYDNDTDLTNMTLYGSSSPTAVIDETTKQLKVGTGTATNDMKARIDSAGSSGWVDIIMSSNVKITSTSSKAGLCWHTTSWNNVNDSYAYNATIDAAGVVVLGKGGNGSSSFTQLGTATLADKTAPFTCNMRIESISNTHTVYIDDEAITSSSDSSWPNSGYPAMRLYQNGAAIKNAWIDSFGIIPSGAVTWTSQGITLTSLGNYGASKLVFNQTVPGGTTMLVEVSVNNGSSYSTITSLSSLPTLTPGQSLSGVIVKIRVTMTSDNPRIIPTLDGMSLHVTSAFDATGNRISTLITPSSNIDMLGFSTIAWREDVSANTTVTVATSINGGSSYTNVTNGGSIPGLLGKQEPWIDYFEGDNTSHYFVVNSIFDYVNTVLQLGAADGGIGGGLIIFDDFQDYTNYKLEIEASRAEFLNCRMNVIDSNNYDYFVCHDGSSGTHTNSIELIAVRAGTTYTNLAYVPIVFTRGNIHKIVMEKKNHIMKLYFDNVLIDTLDDTSFPIAAASRCDLQCATGISTLHAWRAEPYGQSLTGITLKTKISLESTDATLTPDVSEMMLGLRTKDIETGPIIASTIFNYATLTESLEHLAEQADFWIDIDELGETHFKDRFTDSSPYIVVDSGENNKMLSGSVSVKRGGSDYRNNQVIFGGRGTTDTQIKSFQGTNTARNFVLDYPLAEKPVIQMNGKDASVGEKGIDTGFNFYWSDNDPVVAFDDALIISGATITSIYYKGYFDIVVDIQDDSAIAALKTIEGGSTTGIVSKVDSFPNINSLEKARQIALAKLQRYIQEPDIISFKTKLDGFKPGQIATIRVSRHGLNERAHLIQDVTMQDEGGSLRYVITAVEGFATQSWARYFANLAPVTSVDKLTVGNESTISIAASLSEGISIGENVVVTVYACPICNTGLLAGPTVVVC